MTSWPFRFLFLALLLVLETLWAPPDLAARELAAVTASSPSAPAVFEAAASDEVSLDVARQGYDLLLDRYVQPLKPAELLTAGYSGLLDALRDSGVAVKDGQQLQLGPDRDGAWSTFRASVNQLLRESPPPAGFNPDRVVVAALARSVDEGHTSWLTPEQYQETLARLRGDLRYAGIGIRPTRPDVTIAEVFPGSPAAAAGLTRGDMIITVDGETTAGKTLTEVASLIRGPEGSAVTLEVERARTGERLLFIITRAVIRVDDLSTMMIQDSIGYVRLRSWLDQSIADRFDRFVDSLPSLGPRGLVIDLRGNPGGRVDVGTRVLNRFLDSGPLFEQVERGGRRRVQWASGPAWNAALPVVILIDDGSASMSEIFAAAMQDNGAARLIGNRTAGVVAAAVPYPLSDGSALQVTVMEVAGAHGERLNKVGVAPDDFLDSSPEELAEGRDIPLEAAVLHLWIASERPVASGAAGP